MKVYSHHENQPLQERTANSQTDDHRPRGPVFREGDEGDEMFAVIDGVVDIVIKGHVLNWKKSGGRRLRGDGPDRGQAARRFRRGEPGMPSWCRSTASALNFWSGKTRILPSSSMTTMAERLAADGLDDHAILRPVRHPALAAPQLDRHRQTSSPNGRPPEKIEAAALRPASDHCERRTAELA